MGDHGWITMPAPGWISLGAPGGSPTAPRDTRSALRPIDRTAVRPLPRRPTMEGAVLEASLAQGSHRASVWDRAVRMAANDARAVREPGRTESSRSTTSAPRSRNGRRGHRASVPPLDPRPASIGRRAGRRANSGRPPSLRASTRRADAGRSRCTLNSERGDPIGNTHPDDGDSPNPDAMRPAESQPRLRRSRSCALRRLPLPQQRRQAGRRGHRRAPPAPGSH